MLRRMTNGLPMTVAGLVQRQTMRGLTRSELSMPNVIRLGDSTSHDGAVVDVAAKRYTIEGIPVAGVGDRCSCPIPGMTGARSLKEIRLISSKVCKWLMKATKQAVAHPWCQAKPFSWLSSEYNPSNGNELTPIPSTTPIARTSSGDISCVTISPLAARAANDACGLPLLPAAATRTAAILKKLQTRAQNLTPSRA
jgi:uncharacterized Zn-binding protein involved in type VI secretion